MEIHDHEVFLFIGDSITDCKRDKAEAADLGKGYVFLTAAHIAQLHPEKKLTFINKGVNGNRVGHLQERWQSDCIDLSPTIVSIYIGINDTWRRFDRNDPTTAEQFEAGYRDILDRTQKQLQARIILIEPFVLPIPEDRKNWREDLDAKIAVIHRLAAEYRIPLVRLDEAFAEAAGKASYEQLAPDGVHPTLAGHALIAKRWLDTVGINSFN